MLLQAKCFCLPQIKFFVDANMVTKYPTAKLSHFIGQFMRLPTVASGLDSVLPNTSQLTTQVQFSSAHLGPPLSVNSL